MISIARKFPAWALVAILLTGSISAKAAPSLTLTNSGSGLDFTPDVFVIAGAKVTNVPPQPAAFEAYAHYDRNNTGAYDGGDARRRSIGTYNNGQFGLYAMSQNWGAYNASHSTAGAHGVLEIDDVMITTADAAPPATIPVSLNFHVSGATPYFDFYEHDLLTTSFDMRITLNGTVFNGKHAWSRWAPNTPTTTVTGLGTQIAGGGFSQAFSSTITTDPVNVPVNSPFTVRVEFTATAGTGGRPAQNYSSMIIDAGNTAGFLPGESIFNNLPGGYSVNSGTGLIVDNNVVPEPATLVLLSMGGLIALRKRSRQ
jgi:hypothetical protein